MRSLHSVRKGILKSESGFYYLPAHFVLANAQLPGNVCNVKLAVLTYTKNYAVLDIGRLGLLYSRNYTSAEYVGFTKDLCMFNALFSVCFKCED